MFVGSLTMLRDMSTFCREWCNATLITDEMHCCNMGMSFDFILNYMRKEQQTDTPSDIIYIDDTRWKMYCRKRESNLVNKIALLQEPDDDCLIQRYEAFIQQWEDAEDNVFFAFLSQVVNMEEEYLSATATVRAMVRKFVELMNS